MQKPASTFEEFLRAQHLKDWPEDIIFEDYEPSKMEADTQYSFDEISEHLRKFAPMHSEFFASMEMKISEHESLLKQYYSQLFMPKRSEDKRDPTHVQTFITDIENLYETSAEFGMVTKRKAFYRRFPREENVEDCVFPGFKKNKLTQLPEGLEGPQVLIRVLEAQHFTTKIKKFWKNMFLSEASVALLLDSFWWFLLEKFQPSKEDQDYLYDRIADSFVALFWSIHHNVKDIFFKVYADCLCQAISAVFFEAFPKSRAIFGDDFKNELMDTIFQWMSGMRPPPYSWKKWNVSWLQKSGSDLMTDKEASMRKQLDFNLDDLIRDAKKAMRIKSGEENEDMSLGDISEETSTIKESTCIGPGPDFYSVIFELSRRSPLVSHYLKMHEITNVATGFQGQRIKHIEMCNLPCKPAVPTYHSIIKETQALRRSLQKDYIAVQDKTRREIEEIEQQKIKVNRHFERLKKDACGAHRKYNALLLEKMQLWIKKLRKPNFNQKFNRT
ncbi:protein FAM227B isoform X2 [Lissotriton helveticus]